MSKSSSDDQVDPSEDQKDQEDRQRPACRRECEEPDHGTEQAEPDAGGSLRGCEIYGRTFHLGLL